MFATKAIAQIYREEAESRGYPAADLQVIEIELRGMEEQLQSLIGQSRQTRDRPRVSDLDDTTKHAVALFSGPVAGPLG